MIDRRTKAVWICILTAGVISLGTPPVGGSTTVPVQAWVAHYNGPVDGYDWSNAIAVDGQGNVVVTGRSDGAGTGSDFATVKYDPDGNKLWVARYNGAQSEDDEAYSLALDPAGNVYVAGYGTESGTGFAGYDYVTIKYDPDGNELWVARYNGPENDGDVAYSLRVDGAGNACVTGRSRVDQTNSDVVTVKYDPDGNELWVARYNGPVSGHDTGGALRVDGAGNVYVTGSSEGDGTDLDYVTIKYDPDGDELWVARYNGPTNGSDTAGSMALDAAANVYVTGLGSSPAIGSDYLTVKYDTDGNELWVRYYDSPWHVLDRARSVALDPGGGVYVTGDVQEYMPGEGTREHWATVKYDEDGNELWVALHDAPLNESAGAYDVAVNQQGKVYVTGFVELYPPEDNSACRTIKYDSDGNVVGIATYDNWLKYEWSKALALDAAGNVYVLGTSSNELLGLKADYLTIKYVECLDNDEDGYGDPACGGDDCDDSNPGVNPGTAEVCTEGDGLDDDCDGLIDGEDPDCICIDNDQDGYGDPASPACTYDKRDCDDTNPDAHPGATEIPGNGINEDCDPSTPPWGVPASVVGGGSGRLSAALGCALLFVVPAAFLIAWKRARQRGRSPIL